MRTFFFAVALVAATSTSVHAQTHEELVRDGNGGSTTTSSPTGWVITSSDTARSRT